MSPHPVKRPEAATLLELTYFDEADRWHGDADRAGLGAAHEASSAGAEHASAAR